MASQIAQRAAIARPSEHRTVRDMILDHQAEFESALGDSMTAEHFMRGVFTTITANPELGDCTEASLAAGLLWAAQLNLEIGNGMNQFHLTPRTVTTRIMKDGKWVDGPKEKVCVPMVGYQGYITLAYRHPKVLDFQVVRIRDEDFFEYQYTTATGKQLRWAPILPIDLTKRYVGGIVRIGISGGGVAESYMHVSEIEARRPEYTKEQIGQGGKPYIPRSPWTASRSSYEAMCDKTIIREAQKWAPKSIEMERALAWDGRVLKMSGDGSIDTALTYEQEFGDDAKAVEP